MLFDKCENRIQYQCHLRDIPQMMPHILPVLVHYNYRKCTICLVTVAYGIMQNIVLGNCKFWYLSISSEYIEICSCNMICK